VVSFSITFSNVLLMLLYLLPGFLFCKTKKIQPDHLSSVSVILLYICGFALYVNALYGLKPSPELFAKMGLFLLISLACETAVMLLILRKNDVQLSYTQQELIRLGLDIATDCANPDDIIAWIEAHSR